MRARKVDVTERRGTVPELIAVRAISSYVAQGAKRDRPVIIHPVLARTTHAPTHARRTRMSRRPLIGYGRTAADCGTCVRPQRTLCAGTSGSRAPAARHGLNSWTVVSRVRRVQRAPRQRNVVRPLMPGVGYRVIREAGFEQWPLRAESHYRRAVIRKCGPNGAGGR